jgi:uncharacterized protein
MNKESTQNIDGDLDRKLRRLREILREYRKVVIAYSGGVDSVFLLKVAVDCLGVDQVLACIGVSESLARSEYESALNIAKEIGATVEIVHPQEMANPQYQANPANRCYYCKMELYGLLSELARQRGYDVVLCGTNADDLTDFRPGLQAAKKYNVISPLEAGGLTKEDIRVLSQAMHLPTWDKPAQPCLASRMAYGMEITPERLRQVERGEEFLRQMGLRELRVRHHGNLVRIEVPCDQIMKLVENGTREKIVAFFRDLGFTYVSLDLQGFRSGSGNESFKK